MAFAASLILREKHILLPKLWRMVFQSSKYDCEKAQRKFLQMPIASMRLKTGVVVTEKGDNAYYADVLSKIHQIEELRTATVMGQSKSLPVSKTDCQDLLDSTLTQYEAEKIKHTIASTHNLSKRQAEQLGIRNMSKRAKKVELITETVKGIKQKHRFFSKIEQKAFLQSQGINSTSYLSSDSDTSDTDSGDELNDTTTASSLEIEKKSSNISAPPVDNNEVHIQSTTLNCISAPPSNDEGDSMTATQQDIPEKENLQGGHKIIPELDINSVLVVDVLKEAKFNWFAFVAILEPKFNNQGYTQDVYNEFLVDFVNKLPNLGLTEEEYRLTEQSRAVYLSYMLEKETRMDMIDGDDDTDDDDYCDVNADDQKIHQKLRQIKDKCRKRAQAEIAASSILKRKTTTKINTVEKRHPDIGEVMEKIVSDADVGADKWRRTGVYTFSGDMKKEKRITFKTLTEKLNEHYKEKISYGTVVQLCVARNKRKLSSKRYKGIANIKYQKARKGFNLKFNCDAKWSRSFYKSLDQLQQDGQHILLLNRDDQAGFRLDSTYTHKNTPSLNANGPTITTRTDFLNKHQSQLQTTSYNFSSTLTTSEICCGVVKASIVHEKNPAQHAADLKMLEGMKELSPVFYKEVNGKMQLKDIECIRVDGAGDEGPSHVEVQFLWAERHYQQPTRVTLVTARCSGDSFLNRVELQNGCLARGHANVFIPSTLCGAPYNKDTGDYDERKHCDNMEAALRQYIERVDKTVCMRTTISLFRGVTSSEILKRRPQLLIYLKGCKRDKEKLKEEYPELYKYFNMIWKIRQSHVDNSLPPNYAFLLKCCGKQDCLHPLCSGMFSQM